MVEAEHLLVQVVGEDHGQQECGGFFAFYRAFQLGAFPGTGNLVFRGERPFQQFFQLAGRSLVLAGIGPLPDRHRH